MSGLLDGVRVIEITDLRGALAGRALADLGADVVKVEPPGGDPGRMTAPFVGDRAGADRSIPFLYRNANKRGLVLDLGAAAGRERLTAALAGADVLVENLSADARRAAGLEPAAVRARHPHLIHALIADFGTTGPRARWRLEALPAFAASGALFASGFPARPPCWLPGYAAHDCASVFAFVGVQAALLERARDGEGQTLEVSVQEAAMSGLNPWAITLEDYNRVYPMLPTAFPRNADGNYLVLPVQDGFVRVLPGTTRQWRAFVALLGTPEALAGPEWENLIQRIMNADVIRLVATECLAERRRAEAVAEGRRLGVPIGPVNTPEEFVAEAQTVERGFFRRTGFPFVGDAPFAAAPFVFSRTPVSVRRPAPAPGEGPDGTVFPPRAAIARGSGSQPAQPLLAGLKVLSFGVVAVGPEVGWMLAEFGAEVVKVESRVKLDPLRATAFDAERINTAFTFNDEHRGHRSLALDLATTEGRALALRLAGVADVVIENNRGGVVRSWGLDYDDVRRVRPDIIYLASQGYGRGGPLGETQAFGPMNSAFAGLNLLWNFPDAPYPAGTSLNHPDHIVGKFAAGAILAALAHRQRTGEGQFIDMAQTEGAAFLAGEHYLEGPLTGHPARARGNAVAYACPHGVFPAAGSDRWIAIAVVDDGDWERLCRVVGWTLEPALATLAQRLAAREALEARLAAWTARYDAEEAAALLQAGGVSAMPVQSADDHRADAHLASRGAIVTVEHPEIGPERHVGNPLRMGRTRGTPTSASPCLGADTADVLGRWLGLDAGTIAGLERRGVCR